MTTYFTWIRKETDVEFKIGPLVDAVEPQEAARIVAEGYSDAVAVAVASRKRDDTEPGQLWMFAVQRQRVTVVPV